MKEWLLFLLLSYMEYHIILWCARLFSKAKLYIDCFKKDSEDYNISQKNQYLTKINVFFFC